MVFNVDAPQNQKSSASTMLVSSGGDGCLRLWRLPLSAAASDTASNAEGESGHMYFVC